MLRVLGGANLLMNGGCLLWNGGHVLVNNEQGSLHNICCSSFAAHTSGVWDTETLKVGLSGADQYCGSDVHDVQSSQDSHMPLLEGASAQNPSVLKCLVCSQSKLLLVHRSEAAAERACNGCAASVQRAPVVRQRLDQLAGQLHDIAGVKVPSSDRSNTIRSFAALMCVARLCMKL
eukprot:6457844-Amphidinium_carterae.1